MSWHVEVLVTSRLAEIRGQWLIDAISIYSLFICQRKITLATVQVHKHAFSFDCNEHPLVIMVHPKISSRRKASWPWRTTVLA